MRKVGTLASRNCGSTSLPAGLVLVVRLHENRPGPSRFSTQPPAARNQRGAKGPQQSGTKAQCKTDREGVGGPSGPDPSSRSKGCGEARCRGRGSLRPRKHFRRGASRVEVMAPLQRTELPPPYRKKSLGLWARRQIRHVAIPPSIGVGGIHLPPPQNTTPPPITFRSKQLKKKVRNVGDVGKERPSPTPNPLPPINPTSPFV